MAAPDQTTTLTCKECSYANEPERVYCHNCGAKLDRSVLPKEEQLRRESPQKARRRIMRMTNPGAGFVKQTLSNFAKTIGYAIFAAGFILMLRAPSDLPGKGGISMRMVSTDLLEMMQAQTPKGATFSQSDINNFLGTAKSKAEGLIPGVKYKRSFVNLEPGVLKMTMERSFWGYPMYYGTIYRAEANSGVFTAVNVGGNVGRLPVHPTLWQYLEPVLLKDIRETFTNELKQVKQAGFLRIEKERVTLTNKR